MSGSSNMYGYMSFDIFQFFGEFWIVAVGRSSEGCRYTRAAIDSGEFLFVWMKKVCFFVRTGIRVAFLKIKMQAGRGKMGKKRRRQKNHVFEYFSIFPPSVYHPLHHTTRALSKVIHWTISINGRPYSTSMILLTTTVKINQE